MSVLPRSLKMSMAPAVPSCTTTTADTVFPAGGFKFDVPENEPPAGNALRNVDVFPLIAVRLRTIAVALPGMPLNPATVQTSVS
jgi:hypothetical protein